MAVYPGGGGGFPRKKVKWKRGVQGPATFYGGIARNIFAGQPIMGAPAPRGGGGGNPYAGLISDYLNQARADFAAQSAADAASRDAALRRYIISYGEVPDLDALGISKDARGFLEKALDPHTRELAAKNMAAGTAIKARQAHANEIAQRRIPAGLAARGMLRSGQTGSDLKEQALQYKIQGFDTLNEMLGGIEGTVGGFLDAERQRQRELAQAAMDASMSAMGDWGGDDFGGYGNFQPYNPGVSLASGLGIRPSGSGRIAGRPTRPRPAPRPYPKARRISLKGLRPGGRMY